MTTHRSRGVRPLLLTLVVAALALVGCSPSTLLTLNVEALQFIPEADQSATYQTIAGSFDEVLPDADGWALSELGLASDLIGSLTRLSLDVSMDLSATDVSVNGADPSGAQGDAWSLTVTIYVADDATVSVTDGEAVASDTVTFTNLEDEGSLDLSVTLSETENADAFALLGQGASLGMRIEANVVEPAGVAAAGVAPLISVTATVTKFDIGVTTSLPSLLNP
jgi:hypothetical protein